VKVYDPDLISDDPTIRRIDNLVRRVGDELLRATDRFPAFNSPHEGWAVIKEEMDELWEHVRGNTGRSHDAHKEAVQVAAMALRYVLDLRDGAARSAGQAET
jgi:hypothetical protein